MAETNVAGAKQQYVPAPLLKAEEIEKQIAPLSEKPFLAFFQKIWRAYLAWWYGFSDRHPKGSKLIYQLVFFVLFSQAVTIFQFLLFLFLPNMFGLELAGVEWFFPSGIELATIKHTAGFGETPYPAWNETFYFFLLGKPVVHDTAGNVVIGGGLGYFLAFLIATFLAQCINFPLQRNITFKSHGNPVVQAIAYFIGWVLIQPFCDMLGSLYTPLAKGALGFSMPNALKVLLDTIVMGGVSMAIFFVVFLFIFPDYNKMEKTARAKLENLRKTNGSLEMIAKAEAALKDAEIRGRMNRAEKEQAKYGSQISAKAIAYFSAVKELAEAKEQTVLFEGTKPGSPQLKKAKEHLAVCKARVPERQQSISDAVAARDKLNEEFPKIKEEYDNYMLLKKAGALGLVKPAVEKPVEKAPEPVQAEAVEEAPVWTEVIDEGVWVENADVAAEEVKTDEAAEKPAEATEKPKAKKKSGGK